MAAKVNRVNKNPRRFEILVVGENPWAISKNYFKLDTNLFDDNLSYML